jgi:hypothetical protein
MSCLRRAALTLSLIVLTAPASAQATAPVFGIKAVGPTARGYFTLAAAPGATVSGSVRVVNAGRVAGTADVLAADATTGRTTGAVYETARRAGVGGWLRLERSRIFLAPGRSTVVHFVARVPATAAAGDHLGGIAVRPVRAAPASAHATAKHAFRVDLVEQAIVAVQITVPGASVRRLAVTSVRAGANPGYQTLLVGLANGGNRMLKATGIAKVTNQAGATLRRQAFTIDTFLPATSVEDPVVLRGPTLPAGRYFASVLIRWPGGSSHLRAPLVISAGQVRQVYGSPGLPRRAGLPAAPTSTPDTLVLIGGALALLLAGIGGTTLAFRRRNRPPATAPAPFDTAGDAIRVTDARPAPEGEAVGTGERPGGG